jgi:D-tyrosyl-tRNA(Tyr) deacylase
MRALIQRVQSAQVLVEQQVVGEIDMGLLAFIGLGKGDSTAHADKLLDKLLAYRVFGDDAGKMSLSLTQTGGGLLLVSQFTLMAATHKGLRPDFAPAMPPTEAKALFEYLVSQAQARYPQVQTGIFGADMQVSLVNDGPVTFMLEV